MIITFVLPGISPTKPVGGFKIVYEYGDRLSERWHRANTIHPLMLFTEEMDLKDKRKICSPSTASPVLVILEFGWFDISLRE